MKRRFAIHKAKMLAACELKDEVFGGIREKLHDFDVDARLRGLCQQAGTNGRVGRAAAGETYVTLPW